MTEQQISKPARDSIFGVCAAVASDFGINPLWLRLSIGAALMWNLEVALTAYATLATVVLISRLAAPDRRAQAQAATSQAPLPAIEQDTGTIDHALAA